MKLSDLLNKNYNDKFTKSKFLEVKSLKCIVDAYSLLTNVPFLWQFALMLCIALFSFGAFP